MILNSKVYNQIQENLKTTNHYSNCFPIHSIDECKTKNGIIYQSVLHNMQHVEMKLFFKNFIQSF